MSAAFNFDFIKNSVEPISQICDNVFEKIEKEKGGGKTITLDLTSTGTEIISNFLAMTILGGDEMFEKVEDINFLKYLMEVSESVFSLSFDPLVLLFGSWVFKLGIKKEYRDCKRRVKVIKGFLLAKMNESREKYDLLNEEEKKKSKVLFHQFFYHSEKEGATFYNNSAITDDLINVISGVDATSPLFAMMTIMTNKNPKLEKAVRE